MSTPKYPFPAHVNVVSFVTIKLNDGNFLLWKQQMLSLIRSQRLEGFVTGRISPPPRTIITEEENAETETLNEDFEDWSQTDNLLKSWICSTLTEDILCYTIDLETSAQVWNMLLHRFTEKTITRELELNDILQRTTKESKKLDVYLREFKYVCDQLSAIGKPIDTKQKIYRMLNGLPHEYDTFKTTMYHTVLRDASPSYEETVLELKAFETRNKQHLDSVNTNMVFYSQRSNTNYQGNGRQNQRNRSYNYGNQNRGRGGSSFTSRGRGFQQQTYNQTGRAGNTTFGGDKNNNEVRFSNSAVTCQICKKTGHSAARCWFRYVDDYQNSDIPEALTTLQVEGNENTTWFPDTGATAHVTDATGILLNLSIYSGTDSIMVGDGSLLNITHTGKGNLVQNGVSLPLKETLVVPEIRKDLLSVSKLTSDFPCYFVFDKHGVVVKDSQTNKTLAAGQKVDGH